ncbi:hypothetical protein J5N97_013579 [Dioscorea zingiberensis]|uniref:Transmembrane protein n=1 Tax=Dioscorea zingiberensis TaxID=325984 RepID=A0A9D5HIS2_9LILI|nr:hypothetical protein J5N97_013579 [Dioscorea zingiberensis]
MNTKGLKIGVPRRRPKPPRLLICKTLGFWELLSAFNIVFLIVHCGFSLLEIGSLFVKVAPATPIEKPATAISGRPLRSVSPFTPISTGSFPEICGNNCEIPS